MADIEYKRLDCAGHSTPLNFLSCLLSIKPARRKWIGTQEQCSACGSFFIPNSNRTTYCSRNCFQKSRAIPACKCLFCGVSYKPKAANRTTFCSRDCNYASLRAAKASKVAKPKAVELPFSRVRFNDCRVCGKEWTASKSAKLCSVECKKIEDGARGLVYAMERHQINARVVRCSRCSCEYCPLYRCKTGSRPHCTECKKVSIREHKRLSRGNNAKRAKRAGAAHGYFNEVKVLERDGWRCRLCGVSTPKKLRGTTDLRAPELDHIIPIAAGGGHIKDNVQCACRRCNGLKGSKPLGQLLLAGFG